MIDEPLAEMLFTSIQEMTEDEGSEEQRRDFVFGLVEASRCGDEFIFDVSCNKLGEGKLSICPTHPVEVQYEKIDGHVGMAREVYASNLKSRVESLLLTQGIPIK